MIVDVTGLKFYTNQRTRATTAGAARTPEEKSMKEDKTETPKKLMPKVNPEL